MGQSSTLTKSMTLAEYEGQVAWLERLTATLRDDINQIALGKRNPASAQLSSYVAALPTLQTQLETSLTKLRGEAPGPGLVLHMVIKGQGGMNTPNPSFDVYQNVDAKSAVAVKWVVDESKRLNALVKATTNKKDGNAIRNNAHHFLESLGYLTLADDDSISFKSIELLPGYYRWPNEADPGILDSFRQFYEEVQMPKIRQQQYEAELASLEIEKAKAQAEWETISDRIVGKKDILNNRVKALEAQIEGLDKKYEDPPLKDRVGMYEPLNEWAIDTILRQPDVPLSASSQDPDVLGNASTSGPM